jgi:hypothetical protein
MSRGLLSFSPNGRCRRRPFQSRNGRPAKNSATRSGNWPRTTAPFVSRIIALERELASLDAEIARQERKMNALVHALYSLSLEEIETVEKG